MQAVLLWLAALAPVVIPIVVRIATALGFTVATYTGLQVLWGSLESAIWASLGSGSASVLTILGMARIDDAMQVMLSAGATILLLKGMNAASGALSKWRAGPNPGAFNNV